jgi:hypothetical protein
MNQVEAELFKESEKLEEKAKHEEIRKLEPLVKPGVSFSATLKKPDSKGISFGSKKPTKVDLTSLIEQEGKEVHPLGTKSKIQQLDLELSRFREENSRLNSRQNELQNELAKAVEQNRKYSIRVQELESAAKEKDNLRDEVSKLTKQLEEHQLQTRQFYDRMKDEPNKDDEKVKNSNQPPVSAVPQQNYNMAQNQQPLYPAAGMQYYPNPYYSQFQHYPQNHPHPQSRYSYDGQGNHPPPNHPPGPTAPSPTPDHHTHFAGHPHEEFRGMRRMQQQPSPRDMGMDKNAQHAPPGYGSNQHYGYPPNVVYQQQFPPGQGQKWSSSR